MNFLIHKWKWRNTTFYIIWNYIMLHTIMSSSWYFQRSSLNSPQAKRTNFKDALKETVGDTASLKSNNKVSLGNALSLPARTRSYECRYLDGLERTESPRDNSPCPQLIVTSPTSDGAHMFDSSEQVKMHLSQIFCPH